MNKRQKERKTEVNRGNECFKPRHSYCIAYKQEQDWGTMQRTPQSLSSEGIINEVLNHNDNSSLIKIEQINAF
jgi:hypothetical protein